MAESDNGIDGFRFWDYPIVMPETEVPDTNIYDMRVVQHEDGWVYGIFCTERRDPTALEADQSAAIAQCGIARTKDLVNWERLPDLKTPSPQQRNVVLHPEFVHGQYAFYTRPQDGFINAGSGGGIGFGLSKTIEQAIITEEMVIDKKLYHTVYEAKNGLGAGAAENQSGMAAYGAWGKAYSGRAAICIVPLHDGPAGYYQGDLQAGRLLYGPGRRGKGGGRLQCPVL